MQLLDTLANSFIQGGYFNSIFYQLFIQLFLKMPRSLLGTEMKCLVVEENNQKCPENKTVNQGRNNVNILF